MDQTLRRLKDEFQRFVGQPVTASIEENKRNRRVGGQMQEVIDKTMNIDWEDPVVQEMEALGRQLGTQVEFEGVVYAGLGGTKVSVELTENGQGQFIISEITPSYC